MNKIAIIIVHFGNPEITVKCVNSLKGNDLEIFVVDNAQNFSYQYEKITVIKNIENNGYASGVNLGIEKALRKGYNNFFVANNDIIFPEDFFTVFSKNITLGTNAVFVPRIFYEDEKNKIWYDGGYINKITLEGKHVNINNLLNEREVKSVKKQVNFFTGAAFFITKKIFVTVGKLNEKFFLYYEDLDYSLRLAKAGIPIYYLPQCFLYHSVSLNTMKHNLGIVKFNKNIYYYRVRNKLWMIKRYAKGIYFWTSLIMFLLKFSKLFLGFIFLLKFDYAGKVFIALKDGINGE
jgi:GT2 family glycosyltransferase